MLVVAAAGVGVWLGSGSPGPKSTPTAKSKPSEPYADPTTSEPYVGPRFEERGEAAGLRFRCAFLPDEQGENFKVNMYDHGAGLALADVDGDGHDDVYFCNQLGPNALFRGRGDGTFEDITARSPALALADRISVTAAFGDVDEDGDPDLYVTTTMGGNALFRNEGGGHFEDVTEASGLTLVAHSQHAVFFDADRDGRLDLLVSNTAKWTTGQYDPVQRYWRGNESIFELVASPHEKNHFYRNVGGGKFVDTSAASGLEGRGWSGDTAIFDYDEDGDLDVMLANMFGGATLYQNDGRGVFHDVTREVLGRVPWGAVACKVFDADGDGRLDLLVLDMHSDMWMDTDYVPSRKDEVTKYDSPMGPRKTDAISATSRSYYDGLDIQYDHVLFGSALFRSLGGGKYEEVSARAGVETMWPWGAAPGDYDEDGDLDVFIPTGMGFPYTYRRNVFLLNQADGTFQVRSREAGFEPPPGGTHGRSPLRGMSPAKSSRAAVSIDADGDGRLDLLVVNFNDRPYLWMNQTPARPHVMLRLTASRSHAEAVGAVVRLRVGGKTLVRHVDAAGGYLVQPSRWLHFGLGDATKVDGGEIVWPSGQRQTLTDVPVGRPFDVVEPP